MTKISNNHMFSAAAAFGAVALFSMLSFGSSAEAAQSVASCKGSTAGAVISCCERLSAAQRPLWMIQSRTNCHEVAACRGGKGRVVGIAAVAVKRCYVKMVLKVNDGGDEKENDTPSRGPNSLR